MLKSYEATLEHGQVQWLGEQAENGVEFWLARDLQFLLGYTKWDNFLNVISKAKMQTDMYTFERFSIHIAENLYRKLPFSIHIENRTGAR